MLTPSLSFRKSQIADYSGPNSRASIGNTLLVPMERIEPAAMPILFQYSFRCNRTPAELAALILAWQGHEQDTPIRRVRDDGDIRKRVNIQRVLQRSGKGQTECQIGISRIRWRQGHYRPDLLAKEIGYRYSMAGCIGADQRARPIVVGNGGRVDADAECNLDGTNRIDNVHRVARA